MPAVRSPRLILVCLLARAGAIRVAVRMSSPPPAYLEHSWWEAPLPEQSPDVSGYALETNECFWDQGCTIDELAVSPPELVTRSQIPCVTTEEGCIFYTDVWWQDVEGDARLPIVDAAQPSVPDSMLRGLMDECFWDQGCQLDE